MCVLADRVEDTRQSRHEGNSRYFQDVPAGIARTRRDEGKQVSCAIVLFLFRFNFFRFFLSCVPRDGLTAYVTFHCKVRLHQAQLTVTVSSS